MANCNCIFCYILFLGKYGENLYSKGQIYSLNVMLFIGAFCYAFAILLLYVFNFGSYEGPHLASFDRYIKTYLVAISFIAMMIYLHIECNRDEKNKTTSLNIIGILLATIWTVMFIANNIAQLKPSLMYYSTLCSLNDDIKIIKDFTDDDDKIYIITQNDKVWIPNAIKYLLMPQESNLDYYSLGEPLYDGDIWTQALSYDRWVSMLSDYDYLYLQNIDKQFISNYSKDFKEKSNIKDHQMYKIIVNKDHSVKLVLIND